MPHSYVKLQRTMAMNGNDVIILDQGTVSILPVCRQQHNKRVAYTEWAKKVSCCIAGCNIVNYAPIYINSAVRKLTKFPEDVFH